MIFSCYRTVHWYPLMFARSRKLRVCGADCPRVFGAVRCIGYRLATTWLSRLVPKRVSMGVSQRGLSRSSVSCRGFPPRYNFSTSQNRDSMKPSPDLSARLLASLETLGKEAFEVPPGTNDLLLSRLSGMQDHDGGI